MERTKNVWNAQAIVLAAGKSTRFKTKKTKLLFNICGRSMILYPLKVLEELSLPMTVVLGHQAELVKSEIEKFGIKNISYALQEEPHGTGHAVSCTQNYWQQETILILYGDTPLLTSELLEELLKTHTESKATITLCTTFVIDPTGYGRVIQEDNHVTIIEEKNCSPEQKSINLINAGIYCVSRQFLAQNIDKLEKNPLTGEWYLTDLIGIASSQNLSVKTFQVPYDTVRGVNTLQDLWSVEQIKRSDFIKHWMSEGVRFELAQSIHIDINVTIGAGSFIGTGVHLLGNTSIGEETFVGAFSIIENTKVGNNSNIHSHSVIQDSVIGDNVHAGPFARLRKNSLLNNNVVVGNFVEIKDTTIGAGSKARHQCYLGNATIGSSVNVGAGTIICNYDGAKKHKTIIKDDAFIGSNNTLIAPITIGNGAYTAGGSTLNKDVPDNSLAIGRSQQVIKQNYAAKRLLEKLPKEKAKKIEKKEKKSINFKGALKSAREQNETL